MLGFRRELLPKKSTELPQCRAFAREDNPRTPFVHPFLIVRELLLAAAIGARNATQQHLSYFVLILS